MSKVISLFSPKKGVKVNGSLEMSKEKLSNVEKSLLAEKSRLEKINGNLHKDVSQWDTMIERESRALAKYSSMPENTGFRNDRWNAYTPYSDNAIKAVTRLIEQAKEFKGLGNSEHARNKEVIDEIATQLANINGIQNSLKSVDYDREVSQRLKDKASSLNYDLSFNRASLLPDMSFLAREIKQMEYTAQALLELSNND